MFKAHPLRALWASARINFQFSRTLGIPPSSSGKRLGGPRHVGRGDGDEWLCAALKKMGR
ncbi:hypothetical protein SPHINGOAX6_20068 [Sphingomonas sp. AX6]|nr:hypothetical protein SPHINGOAX6_20068 [Sphingomonas sp. AX6]